METTLFLVKIFGLYLMVMGAAGALRHRKLTAMIGQFAENRSLIYLTSVLALIVGLLLVVSHNHWVAGWPVIVTLLAWLVLLKALAYLFLPFDVMVPLVRRFNRPAWFTVGGALSLALGIFLAGKGFQIF